ncbi:MAG: biotin--[acetyl-CoA-carboxylase] ligase [Rikenellaceae bacterium]
MLYRLDHTTSTNDDAKEEKYTHGDIIWAEHQSSGRGQRGHTWLSTEGLNLTFSVVLEPRFLPISRQFQISRIAALALCDTMHDYGINTKIKWTNDIYVEDRKLVGILIENRLQGTTLARMIIGIGINVNQRAFDPSLPNPTSMVGEMGCSEDLNREEVLQKFHSHMMSLYATLQSGDHQEVINRYHAQLYRLGEWHSYRLADGTLFEGMIEGVKDSGELIICNLDNTSRGYAFRDVEFIIGSRDNKY